MRTALLIGTLAAFALPVAGAHAATTTRYDLRLSGTQTVTTGGTATLAAPDGCNYSRNETASALYAFRSPRIRVRVRGGRPAQAHAAMALTITGSGRLDQTSTATAGCAEPPAVHESCTTRANAAVNTGVVVTFTGPRRSAVGFGFGSSVRGGSLFGGFGAQCGVLAGHAGLTSPSATFDEPISVPRLFQRPRTVVVGSEESVAFVNVFTGAIQEATCDECVARRTTTRWTITFGRAK